MWNVSVVLIAPSSTCLRFFFSFLTNCPLVHYADALNVFFAEVTGMIHEVGSAWATGSLIREPSTSELFPMLSHPSNPVVFFDIALPVTNPMSGTKEIPTASVGRGNLLQPRVCVEIFAHGADTAAAKNFYELCVGSQSRVVNGAQKVAGYQTSRVYDANPGGWVSLGDVVSDTGRGVFSIFNHGNHFYAEPIFAKTAELGEALPQDSLVAARGIVVMVPPAQATNPPTGSAAGGCCFRILLTPLGSMERARDFVKSHLVVGRVVGRTAADVERSLSHLNAVSKVVFHEVKAAQSSIEALVLPTVVLCGEL